MKNENECKTEADEIITQCRYLDNNTEKKKLVRLILSDVA